MIDSIVTRTIYGMARVANPGVPQRVSAHVVAKSQVLAKAASGGGGGEEDEKTTLDPSWEEEGSTATENGEVIETLRAIGTSDPAAAAFQPRRNNITGVTATGADELTVDDRANAARAIITPPGVFAPDTNLELIPPGRLVVTQGNDVGQELEVIAGKTYSIGRAIDNDFVLSDIAVSRKHFDLRAETGCWLVADRGSGNGTVVNGNIEDHPFKLSHGDSIEIGNTSFRFDLPQQAKGTPVRPQSYQVDVSEDPPEDEEELSTVASKPLPQTEPAASAYAPPVRPKTLPPPSPSPSPSPSRSQRPNTSAPAYAPTPNAAVPPPRVLSHRAPTQPPVPSYLDPQPIRRCRCRRWPGAFR